MLEVDRQSGGFTPSAQLNVFNFLFNRGGIPGAISLGRQALCFSKILALLNFHECETAKPI